MTIGKIMIANTKTVPAGKFKEQCLQLMDQVNRTHQPILITKRGVPVALLTPIEEIPPKLFGVLKGTVTTHQDITKPLDETWDAEGE